ncbi:hypothetical protein D918_01206 [Trichuris suis]|nr:hypothetical protein D918_01206 [Trichuris suis]
MSSVYTWLMNDGTIPISVSFRKEAQKRTLGFSKFRLLFLLPKTGSNIMGQDSMEWVCEWLFLLSEVLLSFVSR